MKKIVIAYHAYLYGDKYMEMMVDQFRKIVLAKWDTSNETVEPNLFTHCDKLYIGINDTPDKHPEHGIEWVKKFWSFPSSKEAEKTNSKIEIVVHPDNKEEAETLKWVRDYAKDNPEDYILYFHMKGISKQNEATEDWRKYMEYFAIERWKDCVAKLDEGYDCCGVMLNSQTPIGYWPHFSGNFWWAKASYINTLKHEYLELPWRYYREFWIGSNPDMKAFEFHNSRMNDTDSLVSHQGHYDIPYPRSNYEIK